MTRDTACDTANPRHHICHSSHTIQRNTRLRLGNARLHSFSFVSVSRLAVGEHMRVGGAGGPATHEARLQKVIPCALTAPNSHPCHTSCSNTGTFNRGHVGDEPWAHTHFPFSQPPNTHEHCVSLCAFEKGAGHERQSHLQWEAVIRRERQCQTRLREPGRDPSQRMMCTRRGRSTSQPRERTAVFQTGLARREGKVVNF